MNELKRIILETVVVVNELWCWRWICYSAIDSSYSYFAIMSMIKGDSPRFFFINKLVVASDALQQNNLIDTLCKGRTSKPFLRVTDIWRLCFIDLMFASWRDSDSISIRYLCVRRCMYIGFFIMQADARCSKLDFFLLSLGWFDCIEKVNANQVLYC